MRGIALAVSVGSIAIGAICIGMYDLWGYWYSLAVGLFALPVGIICTYLNLKA